MSTRGNRRSPKPITIGSSELTLWRLGVPRFDMRDPYYLAVSLSWPGFIATMTGCWLTINLIFATLYILGGIL